MRHFSFLPVAAGLLAQTAVGAAQLSKQCFGSICMQLNIPANTASSGSGDIFFQITAPTSNSWVGLGQGSRMNNANMFVIYTDSTGNNVTISPRLGSGHSMPQHDSSTQVELLAGSGVSNGMMTANVRCANCNSWSGGTMDFSSSSASWQYAALSGSALNSNDASHSISMHDTYSSFNWDLSAAKGGSSQNPFLGSTAASSGSTTSSTSTSSSTSGSDDDGDDSGNSGDDDGDNSSGQSSSSSQSTVTNNGYSSGSGGESSFDHMVTIHGVLACGVFVGALPVGGILIRIFSFPGLLWVHAGLQVLAMAVYAVAVGLGIYINQGFPWSTHAILGLVLAGVMIFQPLFGWMHHRVFKVSHGRSFWSHAHLALGRLLILGGLINGGLGLRLKRQSSTALIAYSALAFVVGVIYIAAVVIGERRRARRLAAARRGSAFVRGEELNRLNEQEKRGERLMQQEITSQA